MEKCDLYTGMLTKSEAKVDYLGNSTIDNGEESYKRAKTDMTRSYRSFQLGRLLPLLPPIPRNIVLYRPTSLLEERGGWISRIASQTYSGLHDR